VAISIHNPKKLCMRCIRWTNGSKPMSASE
jgi:hypothetical protein